jgi:hypothetical protein
MIELICGVPESEDTSHAVTHATENHDMYRIVGLRFLSQVRNTRRHDEQGANTYTKLILCAKILF